MYNRCSIKRLVLEDQESNEKAKSEYSRKENVQNDDQSVKVEHDNLAKLPPTENSISHSNKMYTSKGKTSLHTKRRTQQTVKSTETITKYFRRDKGAIYTTSFCLRSRPIYLNVVSELVSSFHLFKI